MLFLIDVRPCGLVPEIFAWRFPLCFVAWVNHHPAFHLPILSIIFFTLSVSSHLRRTQDHVVAIAIANITLSAITALVWTARFGLLFARPQWEALEMSTSFAPR